MAEQDVSGEGLLLRNIHDHIAERTDTRVDAVTAHAFFDECIDDGARLGNTLPRRIRQGKRRTLCDSGDLLPGKGTIDGDRISHAGLPPHLRGAPRNGRHSRLRGC
ncbi:hypothetical protein D3C86_1899470 [compost metagenome]